MAGEPTDFQEFDPGDDYEIIPDIGFVPELGEVGASATACCTCSEGGGSLCSSESPSGSDITYTGGHFVAFWYV